MPAERCVAGQPFPGRLVVLDVPEQERAVRLELGQRLDLLLHQRGRLAHHVGLRGERRAALLEVALDPLGQLVHRERPDVQAVQVLELLVVEHARRRVDPLDAEVLDELGPAEELVAVVERPAHQREAVDHRLGQVAGVAELLDAGRPVALAQPLAVGAEHHRQVAEARDGRADRLVEVDLARRRRQQVLAPDDGVDLHRRVVQRVHEVVGRDAVGAHHDVVADRRVQDPDLAPDQVLPDRVAVLRRPQPQRRPCGPRPRGRRAARRRARGSGPSRSRAGRRPGPPRGRGPAPPRCSSSGTGGLRRAASRRPPGARPAARSGCTARAGRRRRRPRPSRSRPSAASAGSARRRPRCAGSRRCPRCGTRTRRRCGGRTAS